MPSTLQIHVFTEEAEAAFNRAIMGATSGGQAKGAGASRAGCV